MRASLSPHVRQVRLVHVVHDLRQTNHSRCGREAHSSTGHVHGCRGEDLDGIARKAGGLGRCSSTIGPRLRTLAPLAQTRCLVPTRPPPWPPRRGVPHHGGPQHAGAHRPPAPSRPAAGRPAARPQVSGAYCRCPRRHGFVKAGPTTRALQYSTCVPASGTASTPCA